MKQQYQILPYGFWILEDGSLILFNRNYKIIGKRSLSGEMSFPQEDEWQENKVYQSWFYDDSCTPEKHRKLAEHLHRMKENFISGKHCVRI